jgi:hypothetical protein
MIAISGFTETTMAARAGMADAPAATNTPAADRPSLGYRIRTGLLLAWFALLLAGWVAVLWCFGGKDARRELRGCTDEDAEDEQC